MRQISFNGFSRIKIDIYSRPFTPASCSVTVIFDTQDNAMLLALKFGTPSDPFIRFYKINTYEVLLLVKSLNQ